MSLDPLDRAVLVTEALARHVNGAEGLAGLCAGCEADGLPVAPRLSLCRTCLDVFAEMCPPAETLPEADRGRRLLHVVAVAARRIADGEQPDA
jgi:hypothetical protein